jgi:hypothetical protein
VFARSAAEEDTHAQTFFLCVHADMFFRERSNLKARRAVYCEGSIIKGVSHSAGEEPASGQRQVAPVQQKSSPENIRKKILQITA